MNRNRNDYGIRTAAALLLTCAAAACARPPATTDLVATIGPRDTVAVESYTRFGDTLVSGTNVVAYPRAMIRSYEVHMAPGAGVRSVRVQSQPPGVDSVTTVDYRYTADSVTIDVRRDTLTRRYAVAVHAAPPLPFYEDLFAFWDLSLERALATGADSTFDALAGRSVQPMSLRRGGPASVDFGFPEWGTVHGTMDDAGHLQGLDMSETTSKYTVVRVPAVDVEARATAWAARAQPGVLSPRDSARAEVRGAEVVVDYGRPSVRGRSVYGGELIPFGQVWRTGANAATQLITDRPLVMGGTTIPAGTWSVWSEATDASTWTLIINEQSGQWGTQHDASQDFARVPMTVSKLAEPVERFTITVAGTGASAGTITLAWGDTQGVASFTVQ